MLTYARRNGCNDIPLDLPAAGEVSGVQYSRCDQNADVIFYTIQGGGHAWPGGEPMPQFIVGHTTQDIDATRLMWEFFARQPPLIRI
jgi:polyhydroxybutyrate depolymerase